MHIYTYAITQCNVTQNALCHIADWTNQPNRTEPSEPGEPGEYWRNVGLEQKNLPGPARPGPTAAVVIKILYFNLIFLGAKRGIHWQSHGANAIM